MTISTLRPHEGVHTELGASTTTHRAASEGLPERSDAFIACFGTNDSCCEKTPSGAMTPTGNMVRNRSALISIVKTMVRCSGVSLRSVFGAGHWFHDEVCPTSDVDIVGIIGEASPALEVHVAEQLREVGLDRLGAFPVKVRFLWQSELEGRSVGKSALAPNVTSIRLYIRQFQVWKLLYGAPWPPSREILPALGLNEEIEYCVHHIFHLPSDGFLRQEALPTGEVFDWPDLLKWYLFTRIACAVVRDGYPYTFSFDALRQLYNDRPSDLIHTAYRYRQAGYAVPLVDRLQFYKAVKKDLTPLWTG